MHTRRRPVSRSATIDGCWVKLGEESFYRISSFQQMKPFMMSVPTDTDLWMFITSGGGLTCGRIDAAGSLFPYQTVDQLHDAHNHSGPITLIRVEEDSETTSLWEPFSTTNDDSAHIERNLYKNTGGTRLVFEEINHKLGLSFNYRWAGCDEFGWVRTATLTNLRGQHRRITVLDGLRNILPYGAPLALYQQSSVLIDAYRRADVDPETGLGIFSLSAGITDRAEAVEVLQANTVWSSGLNQSSIHLSDKAVAQFRRGQIQQGDTVQKGGRAHYLVTASLDLTPAGNARWHLAANSGQDHDQISQLRADIISVPNMVPRIDVCLDQARDNLIRLIAGSDGIQLSAEAGVASHHFANVMFNCMRGGVFQDNYNIQLPDLKDFLNLRNRTLAASAQSILDSLSGDQKEDLSAQDLIQAATASGDSDLQRLVLEYLPLHFGRRHGDPSRPWNQFAINVHNSDGEQILDYQGNWRDIFQNWEALSSAYPGFLPHFVAKFVNASTVDGFNPYRLSREGVDWEIDNPDDPWSNTGYWGDHQIIYLLKLLEAWGDHDPTAVQDMLDRQIFSYAQVPYRIKPFADILSDPANTIIFDQELQDEIDVRVNRNGSDGKLVPQADGTVYHVNLFEKLLVPALAKLANFVPGAGIWMNTQRPEWNDANNALAGGGTSVVTLFYLRRYLVHLNKMLESYGDRPLPVSREICRWFEETATLLGKDDPGAVAKNTESTQSRFQAMAGLGQSFSHYRQSVYDQGFTGKETLSTQWVASVLASALETIDQTLESNQRPDGLFHTYNMLTIDTAEKEARIGRLPVMLEGQVAAISSGLITPMQSADLLGNLFASPLYQPDQKSFLLAPEIELPSFLEKNLIPEDQAAKIPLLEELLSQGNKQLFLRDKQGQLRFTAKIKNTDDVQAALDQLDRQSSWSAMVKKDRQAVLALFNSTFHHDRYTGRSGYMYGYEGIGCIYWHMVAKLLLATQEVWQKAASESGNESRSESGNESVDDTQTLAALKRHYCSIRDGLGWRKSAEQYGAFPSDPYSHTPADGGARQPGMTGQVKEEILTRLGELGLQVTNGCLSFKPGLLGCGEFGSSPTIFTHYNVNGEQEELPLSPGTMAFTFCQVPVIYEKTHANTWTRVSFADGSEVKLPGQELDKELSGEIFSRGGKIKKLRVGIPAADLF